MTPPELSPNSNAQSENSRLENAQLENSRFKSALLFLLKAVLALALVAWLWKSGRLDFSRLAATKIGADFFAMLFFQAAMLFCIALRWYFLTRACGLNFPLIETLRISAVGHFAAVWTPAGLGLDGARLWQSRRLAPNQMPGIIASTLWDRALGVWSLIVLSAFATAVFIFLQPVSLGVKTQSALSGALLVCSLAAILPVVARTAVLNFLAKRQARQALASNAGAQDTPDSDESTAFNQPLWNHRDWKIALLLAFATHACNAFSLWCALRVLGASEAVSLPATLLVAPLIILSSLVPLTPLGLGVTDAAASTLLHLVGSSGGAEATMLGRATFVLLSALCGLAWLAKNDK